MENIYITKSSSFLNGEKLFSDLFKDLEKELSGCGVIFKNKSSPKNKGEIAWIQKTEGFDRGFLGDAKSLLGEYQKLIALYDYFKESYGVFNDSVSKKRRDDNSDAWERLRNKNEFKEILFIAKNETHPKVTALKEFLNSKQFIGIILTETRETAKKIYRYLIEDIHKKARNLFDPKGEKMSLLIHKIFPDGKIEIITTTKLTTIPSGVQILNYSNKYWSNKNLRELIQMIWLNQNPS
jgi:hypothetical protein